MRKKLDTRFPAARIKKIMQADEDVGKIAMAVPLLVSKALELFLQDLCDRTYEITLQRGAKTMNSLHLKQCVRSFNVFDFLREIVGKVPDLGGSDAAGEDKSTTKRRKVADDEDNDSDDESKRVRMKETVHTNGSSRGRGRGRGRGRVRSNRVEKDTSVDYEKLEVDPEIPEHKNKNKRQENLDLLRIGAEYVDSNENLPVGKTANVPVRNFDLNLGLDENGDTPVVVSAPIPSSSSKNPALEMKHEEYPGWSLADVERMEIDPIHLASLNRGIDEEEEDYDDEG